MAKKKTTVPSANNVGAVLVTRWTTEETSRLLEYGKQNSLEISDEACVKLLVVQISLQGVEKYSNLFIKCYIL
ncbi:hypothetical protein BDR03DRAFT_414875 [Suillus americanus]|nr:hypothetical protein BDR03DRAFT_414875 [Suillus americanus]